jgi:hypothetical protein
LFFARTKSAEAKCKKQDLTPTASLIAQRKRSAKQDEDSYQILVTAQQGNSLRAYVNAYGKKGKTAGKKLVIG